MANQVLPWWAFALMGVGLVAFVAMLVVSVRRHHGIKRSLFASPYVLWMIIFTILPVILLAAAMIFFIRRFFTLYDN